MSLSARDFPRLEPVPACPVHGPTMRCGSTVVAGNGVVTITRYYYCRVCGRDHKLVERHDPPDSEIALQQL